MDDEDTSEAEEEEKPIQKEAKDVKPDYEAIKRKLLSKIPDAFKLDDDPLPMSTRYISEE